ncbi:MAG: hypothetical protein HQ402_03165 [Parcubacteria group bacterium]|nr:hypothetical protein [Parcubacteria group bacterium]
MSQKNSLIIATFLIVLGVASRLLPHVWNTTPMTAIALFATAYLGLRYSVVIFIAIMAFADIFLGFYQWPIMLSVYGSFILVALLGLYLRKNKTAISIFGIALSSSVLFFLITNWAVWQFSGMYVHSWLGLTQSYTLALPFFRNSLFGDLFYTSVFFGAFEFVKYFVSNRVRICNI